LWPPAGLVMMIGDADGISNRALVVHGRAADRPVGVVARTPARRRRDRPRVRGGGGARRLAPARSPSPPRSRTVRRVELVTGRSSRQRGAGDNDQAGSANADQVYDEHERLVWSDRPPGAALAVREHRRDRDPPATADPHSGHTLIPASDDLALTQTELEGAATIPRRVELLPGLPRHADVVHLDDATRDGLVTVSDDDVLNLELIRRRLAGRHNYLWLLTYRHNLNLLLRPSRRCPLEVVLPISETPSAFPTRSSASSATLSTAIQYRR